MMAYFMNEDGIRQGSIWDTAFFRQGQRIGASIGAGVTKVGVLCRGTGAPDKVVASLQPGWVIGLATQGWVGSAKKPS